MDIDYSGVQLVYWTPLCLVAGGLAGYSLSCQCAHMALGFVSAVLISSFHPTQHWLKMDQSTL